MIWIFLAICLLLMLLQAALMRSLLRKAPMGQANVPISVIVAARNEAQNLPKLLEALSSQVYDGEWEALIALDRCNDGSKAILEAASRNDPRIRYIEIEECPEGWSPKKNALRLAIQAAKHPHLAFTDADCLPGPKWLSAMGSKFASGKELVLGTSPYLAKPSLLNALIRFETLMTAMHYIGLADWGLPYMAVGRNMGYTKVFFEAAGGFGEHASRLSGDDDLLVNRAAKSGGTVTMAGADALVYSEPEKTWKDWLRQKLRHGSAGAAYSRSSLAILSAIHLLHILFYVSLIGVLCMQQGTFWAFGAYLLRNLAMMGMIAGLPWRNKFAIVLLFPMLDILYLLYLGILMPAAAFIQPQWKVRNGGSV